MVMTVAVMVADDVSAPKQPGEIPGVVVLMKREKERNQEIEPVSEPGEGGV